MARYLLFAFSFCCSVFCNGQRSKIDSLSAVLSNQKNDSNKVNTMWHLADTYNSYKPDTALVIAEEALFLAQKLKYTEGESRSLGILANSFLSIGNYPKALEFYIKKLKIEEKRNNPHNLASVTMNIGIVYVYQEEYQKALPYYYEADSIIDTYNVTDFKYNIAVNIGDLYFRMKKLDSAFNYFKKSLAIALQQQNGSYTGTSMVGLAHIYLKQLNYPAATDYYKNALSYLEANNNDDLVCEAYLGLANLYDQVSNNDSAGYYARKAFSLAKKDGFLTWQLRSVVFLDSYYTKVKKVDSAYSYLRLSQLLRDSISSNDKVRESQVISSDEQLRQAVLIEQRIKARKERVQQLQLLFIGIFIPTLFLFTLLLSRRRIHVRFIKFLGVISLLILFEYLTLLLHPYVLEVTNHTPIYEMLIFVSIAAILIPGHHRIEHWLIEKLTRRNRRLADGYRSMRRLRIKIKGTPSA